MSPNEQSLAPSISPQPRIGGVVTTFKLGDSVQCCTKCGARPSIAGASHADAVPSENRVGIITIAH